MGYDDPGVRSPSVGMELTLATMSDQFERLGKALGDRFTLVRQIGLGGMAKVYLAEDTRHHRKVAIKVLRPELAAVVGRERFLQEIEIVARLRHPHILPLHDSGVADNFQYYVMPFVEGESLRDRLTREKQLSIEDALEIAGHVAGALAYAHDRGVVHRDVKPENIMLEAGHAVVADFGVAFVSQALTSERLTDTGYSPGTPQYMSPEQHDAQREIDGRSDIYSLGCVLYEMLAGDPPFTGATSQAILARKLNEAVPSLRIVRSTVPDPLEQITLKALARTPADRFTTAAEFAEVLEAVAVERKRPALTQPSGAAPRQAESPSLFSVAAKTIGALAFGGVFVSALGFLTTSAFDLKLQIPDEFTPSRADFLVVGGKTLVPFFILCAVLFAVFMALKYVFRLLSLPLRRVGAVTNRISGARSRWSSFWDAAEPKTVAEVYLIAAMVVSAGVIGIFWPLLASLPSRDTEILACAQRNYHGTFGISMAVLIGVLAFTWYRTFNYLYARAAKPRGIAIGRWGGIVWMLLLVVIMTLPWRVLWDAEFERAVVGGERAYIIAEGGNDVVVYNADRGRTERHRTGDAQELVRSGVAGYVFEESEFFENPGPGC